MGDFLIDKFKKNTKTKEFGQGSIFSTPIKQTSYLESMKRRVDVKSLTSTAFSIGGNLPAPPAPIETYDILSEYGDILITEGGDIIVAK